MYSYNFYFKYPILIPRNESISLLNLFKFILNTYFLNSFIELGIGVGYLFIFILEKFQLNISGIDLLYYSIFTSYKNYNNSNIFIFQLNWYYLFFYQKNFDIVFSNPPYLSFSEFNFFYFNFISEFNKAFISKSNGFFDLFYIIKFSYDILVKNGYLFLEHSYLQSKKIRDAMFKSGFVNIYTYKDDFNNNRITFGEK